MVLGLIKQVTASICEYVQEMNINIFNNLKLYLYYTKNKNFFVII